MTSRISVEGASFLSDGGVLHWGALALMGGGRFKNNDSPTVGNPDNDAIIFG